MFTRREIKMMEKGFYPSRCGKVESKRTSSKEVIIGLGDIQNRYKRRGNFKGEHRNKGGILKIVGTGKFRSRIQIIESIDVWNKKTKQYEQTPKKRILHWDKV